MAKDSYSNPDSKQVVREAAAAASAEQGGATIEGKGGNPFKGDDSSAFDKTSGWDNDKSED